MLLKGKKIILGTLGRKCLSNAAWVTGTSPIFVHLKKKKVSKTLLDLKKISEEFKKRNLIPSKFIKFSWPLRMEKAKEGCTWRSCEILILKHSHAQTVKSENREFKPKANEEQGMNSNEGSADTATRQLRLCKRNKRKGECLFIETPNFWGATLWCLSWEAGQRNEEKRQKEENREIDAKLVPGLFESDSCLYLRQSSWAQKQQCPWGHLLGTVPLLWRKEQWQSWHRTVLGEMPQGCQWGFPIFCHLGEHFQAKG